jgi:uncharacterized protein YjbI with pentapeptide repeats
MKIEIKNRFTGEIIFSHEAEENSVSATVKAALEVNTNLSGANLIDANLSGANLSGANLSGANLIDANLIDANLSGANLSGANLIDANLSGANLSGANLIDANLSGANLSGANLIDANLSGADLSGANLIDANLSGANLSGANLSGANLIDANLSGANLSGANLIDANLSGADLSILQTNIWTAYIHPNHIRIGCQYHTAVEWFGFDDKRIAAMDPKALGWWKQWKPTLQAIHSALVSDAEQSRAKQHKGENHEPTDDAKQNQADRLCRYRRPGPA